MLWTREEYLAHMTFESSPREMFCELFGPLVGLAEEWRAQGASEDEICLGARQYRRAHAHRPARAGRNRHARVFHRRHGPENANVQAERHFAAAHELSGSGPGGLGARAPLV